MRGFFISIVLIVMVLFLEACRPKGPKTPKNALAVQVKDFSQRNFLLKRANQKPMILNAKCFKGICNFSVFDSLGRAILVRRYESGAFQDLPATPYNNSLDSVFLYIIQNPNTTQRVFHLQSQAIFLESYDPGQLENP